MTDSLFTRIIKGEVPSYKIYEDDKTLAFLDIHPKVPGHTLVIPKLQIEYAWDLPDEDYQALMRSVKIVANRINEVLRPKWVGMQIEGIAVPHAHVHVFPFGNIAQYHQRADHNAEPNHQELAEMAKKLAL